MPSRIKKGFMTSNIEGSTTVAGMNRKIDVMQSEYNPNIFRWQVVFSPNTPVEYYAFINRHADYIETVSNHILQKNYDLKIIIDLHHPPGGEVFAFNRWGKENALFGNDHFRNMFINGWEIFLERTHNNPVVWGYDIINEPKTRASKLNRLYSEMAVMIRNYTRSKRIIVEPQLGDPSRMMRLKPLPQKRVIYSPHMYYPMQLTHQVISPNEPTGTKAYPSKRYNREKLLRFLAKVFKFEETYNAEILIGEHGFTRYSPTGSQANYIKDCIAIFNAHNWHWLYHSYDEAQVWEPRLATKKFLKNQFRK